MNVILYPNNFAYSEDNPSICIGTNDTYGIPAQRGAPSLNDLEGTQTYFFEGHTIKAFYNCLDSIAIREREKQYQAEYRKNRKPRYSDMKKSAMMTGLFLLLNMKTY